MRGKCEEGKTYGDRPATGEDLFIISGRRGGLLSTHMFLLKLGLLVLSGAPAQRFDQLFPHANASIFVSLFGVEKVYIILAQPPHTRRTTPTFRRNEDHDSMIGDGGLDHRLSYEKLDSQL